MGQPQQMALLAAAAAARLMAMVALVATYLVLRIQAQAVDGVGKAAR